MGRSRSSTAGTWLACALAATAAAPALGWGDAGHEIACEIAYRRLDAAGRGLVDGLIARDGARTFAESCTWADRARRTTHEHTWAYHFVNIPPEADGVDPARDCADRERRCVVWAVQHYAEVLADASAACRTRVEALKFLGHFVADLHQPLHAGRLEDRGGNEIDVRFFGDGGPRDRPMNLHRVWDTDIPRRAGLRWPGSAAELNAAISSKDAEEWSGGDVVKWTDETFRLASEIAYRDHRGRPLRVGYDVRRGYFHRAVAATRVQLQRAGVRLATLIDRAAREASESGETEPARR